VVRERESYLTPDGLAKVQGELDYLRTVRRREVAEQLKKAAEVGGTVDNAEYDEAKREQSRVEGRILELERLLRSAVLIPTRPTPSGKVQVGSTVTVRDHDGKKSKYVIIGSTEADPLKGWISNESPVGKALLGKSVGDEVEVKTPAGTIKLKVLGIQ
jgi:transcription elongation factor GreA